MVQVLATVLVVLIFAIPLGLRLWALLRHRAGRPDADPDLLQRVEISPVVDLMGR